MKRALSKIASLSLAVSLAISTAAFAETKLPSVYDINKRKAVPVQEEEVKKGIEYTPMAQNGIPVTITSKRDTKTHDLIYSYSGKKVIDAGFTTPGVSLRAESDNKLLIAWVGVNTVTVENTGLKPGESANVTVTATHKDYEPVVQTIKISITDGSAAYPHIMATKEDLLSISELGLGENYIQTADIDLNGIRDWTVIGDKDRPFTGIYNGKGFKIKNMMFSTISSEYPGLFGVLYGKRARIAGINLEGRIDALLYPVNWHGTVVGLLDGGTIEDCSFKGEMKLGTGKMLAGGIAADVINAGSIKNCSVSAKISTRSRDGHIGGISGTIEGSIENCTFAGQISNEGERTNVGGITGFNFGTVKDCVVKGDLSRYGVGGTLGGISGRSTSNIQNSAYVGELYIKGNENIAGGISGFNSGGITDCAVKGEVTASGERSFSGGIVGRNQGGTIDTSYAEVNISGERFANYAGGIAGENYSIIDSSNIGRANSSVSVITNCSFTGDIKLLGDLSMAGGAAGRNFGFTSITGGTVGNAKSLIENTIVRAGAINAPKAGRITAENQASTNSAEGVHTVMLINNAALDTILVNGEAITASTSGADIDGQSFTAVALDELEEKMDKRPTAMAFIE